MERLIKRLKGIAQKGEVELDSSFLPQLPQATIERWLRLQREGREPQLVHELGEAIVNYTGCNASDLGKALARPPRRRREDQIRTTPSGGLASELREPKPMPFRSEDLAASAGRLGITRKESR
jgi:hypothetical protein